MITFFPFRATIKKSGIYSELADNESKIKDTVSYFFRYAFRKSGGSVSEDIIYYICLEQNTVLFRITTDMNLIGMYFEENEIINSWNNISYLILCLFNMTYENICSINSVELSESNFKPEQSAKAEYIINILKKKYKNKYIPFSFIAGKDAAVFYDPEIDDIDYPLIDDVPCFSDDPNNNQKTCISYNDNIEDITNDNDSEIYYRMPENTKKGIIQFFRNKREQPSDFINNVFLKTDGGDVPISKVAKQCSVLNEPDSYLFRLDKIVYASGGK